MAKTEWKGGAMLAPLPPTLVTCSDGAPENPKENVLTVAWTGILNTIPPKTYISVRPSRYSYPILRESGVFAINLVTSDLLRAADTCGVLTGAKVNKFERCKLSTEPAKKIACPILADSPLVLECRVSGVIPLGSHEMFLADIVAVDVDETLIGQDGKLHMERADLVAFAHGDYYALGRRLGSFGFSVAKKKKSPNPKQKGRSHGAKE